MQLAFRTTVFALALAAAFGAHADAKQDILATHEAMVKAGRFHSEGTATSQQGTTRMWSNVVWPDRFHIRNGEQEFIIVPGKTYMKQGGEWMPLPMDMSQMVKSLSPEALRQGYENMTNVKDLGESQRNGKNVRGYEYDTQATVMGVTAKSHVVLFVDPATKLPVHQDASGEAMGQKSDSSLDYTFSDDIDVKAPM